MKEYDAIVDEPTSVKAVAQSTDAQSAAIYNLQGQRLNSPQPGVNIIGGEKIVIKEWIKQSWNGLGRSVRVRPS